MQDLKLRYELHCVPAWLSFQIRVFRDEDSQYKGSFFSAR